MNKNQITIIGAGITGLTLANKLSSKNKIKIIEKRDHIGGNCFDYKNKDNILVHKYGPHIFHTNKPQVFKYLSQFTKWIKYIHKVDAKINDKFIPLPFNINSLYKIYSNQKARELENKLKKRFSNKEKVSILKLQNLKDKDLNKLGQLIYKNIFLNYTKKQWDKDPEEIDKEVIDRVPVVLNRDNRYFHDKYQGIPKKGYTNMFKNMVDNKNIKIRLNTDYFNIKDKIKTDILIYTGPLDKFFNFEFGKLDYRSLQIDLETLNKKSFQKKAVVNYPSLDYKFTRITEYKKFTKQKNKKTTISKEYPGNKGLLAWPTLDEKNRNIVQKYFNQAKDLKNTYFVGRLAEYKYFDMDDAIENALNLFNQI